MLKNDKQNFFVQQDGYATKEQGEGQGEKAGGGGEEEGRGGGCSYLIWRTQSSQLYADHVYYMILTFTLQHDYSFLHTHVGTFSFAQGEFI